MNKTPDIQIEGGGSLFMVRPLTDAGKAWLAEHCPADGEHQYLGSALACEHRYIYNLVQGMRGDGLEVA